MTGKTANQHLDLTVGHVHWAFLPTTGGTESHLADLARRQAAAGLRVVILTGEPQPTVPPGCVVESTPLLNLDALRSAGHDLPYLANQLVEFFLAFIERHRVDVIHGHNLHHFFAAPALALDDVRRATGVRIHHTFHETWPDILTDKPVYRDWDANYAISSHVQRECEERLGFTPELRRNPVDTEWFVAKEPAFTRSDGTVTVLHPARMLPWKGVHITVRAVEQLRRSGLDVTLVLTDTQRICDWDSQLEGYRREVFSLIERLNLGDSVEFVSTQYSQMPDLYARSDIVVYPTIGEEPLGLVPLEAMSCRRPVVATRSGGLPESIVEGVTGYLVDRGDIDGLADAIARLAADPEGARQMGDAGRKHVCQFRDIRQYIDTLTQRYRE